MIMTEELLIEHTIAYVKETLQNAEGGHDWFHIERVYKNSLNIAASEEANLLVVKLGALLHDIADSKFHGGDDTVVLGEGKRFLRNSKGFRSYHRSRREDHREYFF